LWRPSPNNTKAIESNPNLVAAYTHRGAVYNARAEWDLAIADLTKAIQLDPSRPDNYQNRAFAYLAKEKYTRRLSPTWIRPLLSIQRQ
jgi:tetratricopeptide (TPR) repeat protein